MTTLTRIYSAVSRLLILTLISALALPAWAVKNDANPTVVMNMPGGFPLINDASQISSDFSGTGECELKNQFIDNNYDSYWRTDASKNNSGTPHSFVVDLQRNIKNIDLVFQLMFVGNTANKELVNPQKMTVYYSYDKSEWTKYDGPDNGVFDLKYTPRATDASWETTSDRFSVRHFKFKIPTDARYLKFESKSRGEDSFALAEFQIYATRDVEPASALIYRPNQFKVPGNNGSKYGWGGEGSYYNLLDGLTLNPDNQKESDNRTYYFATSADVSGKGEQFIQVNLYGRVHPDEKLQLIIRRRLTTNPAKENSPIKLRVEASIDNATYTKAADIVLEYPSDGSYNGLWQGSQLFTAGVDARYLRFYVEEGSDLSLPENERPRLSFDEFRLYKTDREDLINEFYPNYPNLIDKIKTATFKHTHGVIAPQNHWSDILFDYSDWSKWDLENGKWKEDEDTPILKAHGFTMPDYTYVTGTDTINGNKVPVVGNRQRAHTVFHEVYALPGEPINLRSFSDIKNIKDDYSYMENFSRWYDYRYDKKSDRLYFPVDNDEDKMLLINNKGHFAGKEFGLARQVGTVATYYVPVGEPVGEEWIAVDYAQNFSLLSGRNYDREANILYEPRIGFRHVFHITDGKKFADDNMSTHELNLAYAKANRRHVTARADADFQIRIDQSPAVDNKTRSVYPYYNKAAGKYDYVRANDILVYDETGEYLKSDIKFTFFDETKESSQFSYHYTGHAFTFNGKDYPTPSYYRALLCPKDQAKAGKYLVRLVGKDENGNQILVDGQPLIVQEYMIHFVDENIASFTHGDEIPERHKISYLEENISEKPLSYVNFDNYAFLVDDDLKHPENYFTSTLYSEHHNRMYPDCTDLNQGYSLKMEGDYRVKWPMAWNESNYSYMYASGFDFNMYTITNTFNLMPFNAGARETYSDDPTIFWDRRAHDDKALKDNKDNKGKGLPSPRGFMYYVNAASDPGEMVQIPVDNLCPGSTLYVSGWVCEQSGTGDYEFDANDPTKQTPEMANLIVSMQRIDGQGNEQTLHSFVTGYQPEGTRGQWHHFFYSVMLNYDDFGIKIDKDATFRIILENNALSSHGADYAVDDIRVYVAKPDFTATQTVPLCNNESATTVQIAVPFEVMLATFDQEEVVDKDPNVKEGETFKFFYTFLKKDVYEELIKKGETYEKAFNDAIMPYAYMSKATLESLGMEYSEEQRYGWVEFSSCFTENPAADGKQPGAKKTKSYYYIDEKGTKYLVFETDPRGKMQSGDELIVAVAPKEDYPVDENGTPYELCNVFDITTECAIKSVVRLTSSAIVRLNGNIEDPDGLEVCVNQTPVITLDVKDGNDKELGYSQPFDWYDGPMSDKDGYTGYTSQKKGTLELHEVMHQFREEYCFATTLDTVTAKGGFTQPMLDWLVELTTPGENGRPKIFINQTSFVFPPTTVPEGKEEAALYVTAVPINRFPTENEEGEKYIICVEPTEVRVLVKNHAPDLNHGFHKDLFSGDFSYPADLLDVPLRIGLDQIEKVSYDNIDEGQVGKSLKLPLRNVIPASKNISGMQILGADTEKPNPYLLLAETNDYEWIQGSPDPMQTVGKIVDMTAVKGDDITTNCIYVIFDKNFTFREGCYYRFQFNYEEKNPDLVPETGKLANCNGQHVFTIKVVPKYQVWTGEVNRNWANDDNWRRASSADLKLDSKTGFEAYITDGAVNTLGRSYAPLEFTKVIIPYVNGEGDDAVTVPAPLLFDAEHDKRCTVSYNDTEYAMLPENPGFTAAAKPEITTGDATEYINYDMAATTLGDGLSCRPWYTHTVDEIHFAAHATITGQQHLTYDRAWADFELEPHRWQLCSSPLKQTVAGDLYLPTANARQETPLFKEIKFETYVDNKCLYDRFKPAVFQRSWNAASANIYRYDFENNKPLDSADATDIKVIDLVRSKWSNVYNDVKTEYGGSAGFAVKADLAKVTTDPDAVALFRLPKADTEYTYYDFENGPGATDELKTRPDNYKLNATIADEITVSGKTESLYFMVGNPFMCYMDVKAFIKKNQETTPGLLPQIYFVDSKGAHHVLFDEEGNATHTCPDPDVAAMKAGLVPPFTSFFVVLDKAAKSFTYKYDETMMVDATEAYAPELISRSAEDPSVRIEAWRGEKQHSGALLRYAADASADYVGTEDMALLCDDELDGGRVKVFTVAGKLASAINTVPEGTAVGLGLIAPDSDATTVRFSGEIPDGLFLYDAYAGSRSELTADTEFEVEGSSAGRYFITPEVLTDDFDTFGVFVSANRVRVSAPGDGEMLLNVFDMLGRCIYTYNTDAPEHTFSLTQGMYLIDIRRDAKRHSEKIVIK